MVPEAAESLLVVRRETILLPSSATVQQHEKVGRGYIKTDPPARPSLCVRHADDDISFIS